MTMLVDNTKQEIIEKLGLKQWLTEDIIEYIENDEEGSIYDSKCDEHRIDSIFEMVFEEYVDNHYNEILDDDEKYANLIESSVYNLVSDIYQDIYEECYDESISYLEESREFNIARNEAMRGDY